MYPFGIQNLLELSIKKNRSLLLYDKGGEAG